MKIHSLKADNKFKYLVHVHPALPTLLTDTLQGLYGQPIMLLYQIIPYTSSYQSIDITYLIDS